VETGLGDFSFDWVLVQKRVEESLRIYTYDRGGYAWSDPGPKPRTFAQLNLELHDTLNQLGEHVPLIWLDILSAGELGLHLTVLSGSARNGDRRHSVGKRSMPLQRETRSLTVSA
jgi:hypothetical protein